MSHAGGCLCGGIRFTIHGALPPIQVCHCAQCRKAQGGPLATNVPVELQQLSLHDPQGLAQAYESSPGKERVFCRRCGSPIFSRRASLPGVVRIRAGLIDEPVHAHLGFHAHAQDRASWWPLGEDGLPVYPGGATPPAGG